MSIITLNSSSGTRNLGDTSFSLYLNGGEETFVFKPKDSDQIRNHEPFHLARKKAEDREIDVFTADKYFNESTNDGRKTEKVQHKKKDPLRVFDLKEKTVVPARSIHSESSWNSRSALLHNNIPRNQQQPFRKSSKKGFLASIGCNCSCNDENSVETDDDNYLNKSITSMVDNGKEKQELENHEKVAREDEWPSKKLEEIRVNLKTDNHFSFPTVKMEVQEEDDLTPKSLEVFGSPVLENAKNSLKVEKKLTMLNWDTICPRVEQIDTHPSSNGVYNDSDSDSDTSSDLFEIESFSRNTNPFLSRQESDGNSISSCITPTTCYAPSEASIEWSVITASAADFSAMSDADELQSTTTVAATAAAATAGFPQKTVINPPKWRRPSILSGCKSNAAVRVAGDEFPSVIRHHQPESFPSGNKMAAFNKRNGQKQNLFSSGSLSRSHSGSAAHLLYIQ